MLIDCIRHSWRSIAVVAAVYIAVWGVILTFGGDCFVLGNDCSGNAARSLDPVYGYVENGTLSLPGAPEESYTLHPIGYAALLYLTGAYEGDLPFLIPVLIQVALLFFAGLITYSIAQAFWPRVALLGFLLVIFNPNTVFVTIQAKEDSLFAFFIAASLYSVFSFIKQPGWFHALALGFFLGIATNVRPSSYYLIFVIPLLFLTFDLIADRKPMLKQGFLKGTAATILGLGLIFPWLSHVNNSGDGFGLTDHYLKVAWASDFRAMLEDTRQKNLSVTEAVFGKYDDSSRKKLLNDFYVEREKYLVEHVPDWSALSIRVKRRLKYQDMLEQLKGYSVSSYVISVLPNLRFLLLSGGEGEFFKAFGLFKILPEWRVDHPSLYLMIKVTFIGFSLMLKAGALIGMWSLFRSGRHDILIMFSGIILYFVMVHIYHGSPRYRVPIEPIFALLAACGFLDIKDRLQKLKLG
jgi:hypothetical protein